jgi:hypothetical protein
MPRLELIFPHSASADGSNGRQLLPSIIRTSTNCGDLARSLLQITEIGRDG